MILWTLAICPTLGVKIAPWLFRSRPHNDLTASVRFLQILCGWIRLAVTCDKMSPTSQSNRSSPEDRFKKSLKVSYAHWIEMRELWALPGASLVDQHQGACQTLSSEICSFSALGSVWQRVLACRNCKFSLHWHTSDGPGRGFNLSESFPGGLSTEIQLMHPLL